MKNNYYLKLTLVNLITLTRIIGSILISITFFKSGIGLTSILISFLFITDIIDGKLSRKLHVETFLGSLLDAISDKIFMFVMLAILSYYYKPILIVLILEFIIFVINTLAFNDNKNIKSSKIGKTKTVVLDTIVIIMYLFLGLPLFSDYLSIYTKELITKISYILVGIMIGMELLTLSDYRKKSIKQAKYEKINKELLPIKDIIKIITDRDFYINNKDKKLKELLYKN